MCTRLKRTLSARTSVRVPKRQLLILTVCVLSFSSAMVLRAAERGGPISGAPLNVNQLVKDVVYNEIQAELHDHSLWRYQEFQEEDGTKKLFGVCQTKYGEIDRLVALNGEPLNARQQAEEEARIRKLTENPEKMRQLIKDSNADGEQERKLLHMFPQAFRFQYEGRKGDLVTLQFTPNPGFHPSGHAAQVFHHMAGTLVVDAEGKRLARIDGQLTTEVKFWGGLLGHLDAGGRFEVRQVDLGQGHWEMSKLDVEMNGKALFFKTIAVREKEIYEDFIPVPDGTTLKQAELLSEEAEASVAIQKQAAAGNAGVVGARARRREKSIVLHSEKSVLPHK